MEYLNFIVVRHIDDSVATHYIVDSFNSYEDALDCVLNGYYDGDKEQMDFEHQYDDYWDENCNGIEIVELGSERWEELVEDYFRIDYKDEEE